MSSLIFPHLNGQKFPARKSPIFSTKAQKALSGKESRLSFRAYPLYSWDLEYEFLSDQFSQAPARTNYAIYSQDATQWLGANGGTGLAPVTVGNYAIAPDGTLTASRVILNKGSGVTSSDESYVSTGGSPGTALVSLSCWIKTNDGSTVTVLLANPANSSGIICTVTPVWKRFNTLAAQVGSGNGGAILLEGGSGSSNYADLSIWGMQIESGQYATAYIPTNGAAVRQSDLKSLAGFVSQMLGQYDTFLYNDPDFNTVQLQTFATGDGSTRAFNLTATYQPGAEIVQYGNPAPVLGPAGTPEWIQNTNGAPQIYTARYGAPERLSTGSRTNLVLQSQNFGTSPWAVTNATVTGGQVAPDGTNTAFTLAETSATGYHYVVAGSYTLTAGQVYSFSVFVAPVTRTQLVLQTFDGTNATTQLFDLTAGTATNIAGASTAKILGTSIESANNGFYRLTVVFQCGTTGSNTLYLILASGGSTSYAGSAGAGLYIWGAQLEASPYQMAYIPTTTASASNGGSDYSLTNLTTAGAVNTFQQVSFNTAPANNVALLWSGSFFYRCRFSDDSLDFQKDFGSANAGTGIWSLKKLSFESIIL